MTCQEFHNYCESNLCVAIAPPSDSPELAEHVTSCPECNRFIEEHKELEKRLCAVRDLAPSIPASLDVAVLTKYRGYLSEPSPVRLTRRISLRGAFVWAGAFAFAVVVSYGGMFLFIPRQHVWVDRPVAARPAMNPEAPSTANKEIALAQKIIGKAPELPGASVERAKDPAIVAEQDDSFPPGFQSLMYCDEISCPGTMEVIRIQLPAPVLGLAPASARTNGVVSADVLVGPDGIARGIRVVE